MSPDFDRLIERIHEKHRDKVSAADAERDADIAALERVRAICGDYRDESVQNVEIGTNDHENGELDSGHDNASGYGAIARNIRAAVSHMADRSHEREFTVTDVIDTCSLMTLPIPKGTTVSGVLKRLAKEGLIQCVLVGSGKRPSRYAHMGFDLSGCQNPKDSKNVVDDLISDL